VAVAPRHAEGVTSDLGETFDVGSLRSAR
jgi:hypothetical protein